MRLPFHLLPQDSSGDLPPFYGAEHRLQLEPTCVSEPARVRDPYSAPRALFRRRQSRCRDRSTIFSRPSGTTLLPLGCAARTSGRAQRESCSHVGGPTGTRTTGYSGRHGILSQSTLRVCKRYASALNRPIVYLKVRVWSGKRGVHCVRGFASFVDQVRRQRSTPRGSARLVAFMANHSRSMGSAREEGHEYPWDLCSSHRLASSSVSHLLAFAATSLTNRIVG